MTNTYRYLRHLGFVVVTTAAASCISLIGGIGLEVVESKLLPLIPLMIVLPGLNTMVGDYAAIIAAHATDPAERTYTKKLVAKAISKAIWVNIIGLLLLSIFLAHQRGYLFTGDFAIKFTAFVTIASLAVVAAMYGITLALDKYLEDKRLNPDDILIPIVTSITDVMMLALIACAAWFLF